MSPISARLLRLYLRHGLKDNSTATLNALQNAISISPVVPMTFFSRPTLDSIEIEFTLAPSSTYTLTVSGTSAVQDGYSQSLQSQTFAFTTSKLSSLYLV